MRRRQYLALASASVMVTAAGCLGDDDGGGETVRMSRYDPANTAAAPDDTGPTEEVTEEWSLSAEEWIWAPPAVVDGTVYAATGDGFVYALDNDGDEEWSFEADEGIMTTPAVVDGTVYVAEGWVFGDAPTQETTVYALNATDGKREWEFEPSGRARITAVVDGTLYTAAGTTLYALDADSGDEQWSFDVDDAAVSPPAVADGTVYISTHESDVVYALNAGSGEREWSVTLEDSASEQSLNSPPSILGETLYLTSGGTTTSTLYALDIEDGDRLWQFDLKGTPPWLAVAGETVLAGELLGLPEQDEPATLYAVDASDGEERWSVTAENGGDQWAAPTVVGETAYTAAVQSQPGDDTGSTVHALTLEDGTERWTLDIDTGEFVTPSTVVDGSIYINAGDTLFAYSE